MTDQHHTPDIDTDTHEDEQDYVRLPEDAVYRLLIAVMVTGTMALASGVATAIAVARWIQSGPTAGPELSLWLTGLLATVALTWTAYSLVTVLRTLHPDTPQQTDGEVRS